jgi:hypothetical protein
MASSSTSRGFARFESYDATIAEVDEDGVLTARRPGDTAVLAHYAGQIGYTFGLVPQSLPKGLVFRDEKATDVIDRHIVDKLKKLNIVPSAVCDDDTFLRRVHLDVIGQLPTPEAIRKFQADKSPDKRQRVIDELLTHPLHAAVWATKLCDITGADNRVLYDRAVCNSHDWYRNKLAANWPWDKIALGVVTASSTDGRSIEELQAETKRVADERKKPKDQKQEDRSEVTRRRSRGRPAMRCGIRSTSFFDNNKFRVQAGPARGKIDPLPIAQHVATAFLGVRLECAECHKHPHDRWSQEDFLGFTLSFSYVSRGVDPEMQKKKISIPGVYVTKEPLAHFAESLMEKKIKPRVLGGEAVAVKPGDDPRLKCGSGWSIPPIPTSPARSSIACGPIILAGADQSGRFARGRQSAVASGGDGRARPRLRGPQVRPAPSTSPHHEHRGIPAFVGDQREQRQGRTQLRPYAAAAHVGRAGGRRGGSSDGHAGGVVAGLQW